MGKQEDFDVFLNENRDNLRMAFAHGNFDDALKVVFDWGYQKGWQEGMSDAKQVVDGVFGAE